ncbi:MAG: aminotransferase class IV [Flavobacteriales bacterium]|jgi:branched-chain amino acid aminotransferase|nr:aminotransferase class IV [Schleiferiaceae bacterium]|tara:strand:- start:430 stop:1332 length:903 start_codon:yes stop_codon:yes gene_type:complete
MLQSTDPRNKNIQIWVHDQLCPRAEAKVSVFDSSVQGGDAVWEGIRVYKQGVFCLEQHLDRLEDSAKAMDFADVPSRDTIKTAIMKTLKANGMSEDCHIRLTLTRGEKSTSGMDPRLNVHGCTLIVLAEWKPPVYDNEKGISIMTSSIRRNSPMHLDSKIHHANLINNILAKIQANHAGVDSALMLDNLGFISEMNGTNLFLVKDSVLYTPHADACLHGITRQLVIDLAHDMDMPVKEKNLSLTELYAADEAFGTGSMGELTPIVLVDGRRLNNRRGSEFTQRLQRAFYALSDRYCTAID